MLVILLLLIFASMAQAQTATVAIFPGSVTNANTAVPVASPVSYTPTCNLTPKFAESPPPIVDPIEGYYDDPARPTTHDCRVSLATQFAAIPVGAGYKAALKLGSEPYGPFSSAFARGAAQAHPCDMTPVAPSSVNVNQSFTLRWCADSRQTITAWRVYRNGVLLTGTTVVPGTTVNAASLRLYTLTRSEAAAGPVTFEASAVNGTVEGPRHTLTPVAFAVQVPLVVPSAPSRGSVSVP